MKSSQLVALGKIEPTRDRLTCVSGTPSVWAAWTAVGSGTGRTSSHCPEAVDMPRSPRVARFARTEQLLRTEDVERWVGALTGSFDLMNQVGGRLP